MCFQFPKLIYALYVNCELYSLSSQYFQATIVSVRVLRMDFTFKIVDGVAKNLTCIS